MALINRLKQALLVIGALTVLGIGVLAGGLLYLIWDSRKEDDVSTEFSDDVESTEQESEGVETVDAEESVTTETDAEESAASDVTA